jgi:hypothetical protein
MLEKKLINLQTQIKSFALVPMTPMRTSSLRHAGLIDSTTTNPLKPPVIPSKENIISPRKPLKEISSNGSISIQPNDLVASQDPEFVIENSKRMVRHIQSENEKLRARVQSLEEANSELAASKQQSLDNLQVELEKLTTENHDLQLELQKAKAEMTKGVLSPRSSTSSGEISRLSEELAWHAKLHLYAERERIRLLDLLDFAGYEGRFLKTECVGLRDKLSKVSLRSAIAESEGSGKCLI